MEHGDNSQRPEVGEPIPGAMMLNVHEVAVTLRIHPSTVRRWADAGHLKNYRIGPRGDRRFKWVDVERFLNGREMQDVRETQRPRRVLIVDDDPDIRCLFIEVAQRQRFHAIAVATGEEALDKLKNGAYDIMFLDLVLPGLDGVEVLRKMKAIGKHSVVAVMTGYGDELIALEAMELGPLVLLRKPVSVADIANVLELARPQAIL